MDVGLVHVDAQALTQGIERDGMVRVYGIHFDFDKSDMRSQSKPALDAIAEMLRAKPDLSVFIVGHTDSKGSLTHNPELSKARARAVVGKLTAEYGIAAARLDPHGVASLAPVATNTTEEGRQLNRRVELVAR
jgi:outer membrane protein OmpA-like peptidoglycan-associated protein